MSWIPSFPDVVKFLANYAVAPAAHQLGYIVCYKANLRELDDSIKNLEDDKEKVQHQVDEAKIKGEWIESEVQRWLNATDEVITTARSLIAGKNKANLFNLVPNPVVCHQLGRNAKKVAATSREHREKAKQLDRISYHPGQATGAVAAAAAFESEQGFVPLDSRVLILNKIMDALEDDTVKSIGVHGMDGVGKTTLLLEVERIAKESNKFDEVIRMPVMQNPDLGRIGADISLRLGRLNKKGEERNKDKKALVILDDLWQELHLEKIGINEENYKKVNVKKLLCSRHEDVVAGKMSCQSIFSLKALSQEETEKLFKAIAGDRFGDWKTDSLARVLVEKCQGLPVSIIPLAKKVKDNVISSPEEALEQMRKLETGYHSSLEWSYRSLEEERAAELFLTCGVMGNQNIPVDILVKYSVGLGSFGCSTNIMKSARRNVTEWLRKLQASSLLLRGDDGDHVKIHDLVREVSISIATKEGRHLLVSSGKDLQVLSAKTLEKITTISLPHSAIQNLPPYVWRCPNLTTLISHADVQGDHIDVGTSGSEGDRFEVPNFFLMKLKVLDVRKAVLPSLPSSIHHYLKNLTTLCLHYCILEDITFIGKLKSLQVLSFIGSEIESLPKALGELSNLISLDLSKCSKLKVIESGVLQRLTRLEELSLEESFDQWDRKLEGDYAHTHNCSLAELNKLPGLCRLDVRVSNPSSLFQDLPFGRLERCRLLVSDNWDWSGNYEELRTMKLQVRSWRDVIFQQWLQLSLQKVQDLHLRGMEGTKVSVHTLCVEGFKELKHLHVRGSTSVEYIASSKEWLAQDVFEVLESLFVEGLNNLEKICHGPVTPQSFSKLKVIKADNCNKLRNMFSLSLVKSLSQLEEIEVEQCKMMKSVVLDEGRDTYEEEKDKVGNGYCDCYHKASKQGKCEHKGSRVSHEVELANLCRLTLIGLQEIKTFFTGANRHEPREDECSFLDGQQVSLPKLSTLEISDLPKLEVFTTKSKHAIGLSNLKALKVRHCGKLLHLIGSNLLMELQSLRSLTVRDCGVLQEVFDFKGIDSKNGHTVASILPQLSMIKLKHLWQLSSIWTNYKCPRGGGAAFQNLMSLDIFDCKELTNILTPSMAKAMVKLTELRVLHCDKIEAIVMDNEDERNMRGGASNNIIEFPSLKVLEIRRCPNMKGFMCSNEGPVRCKGFSDCWCGGQQAEEKPAFFSGNVLLPRLESIELVNVEEKFHTIFPLSAEKTSSPRWNYLKKVEISSCGSLESVFEVVDDSSSNGDKKKKRRAATASTTIMVPGLQTLKLVELHSLKCIVDDKKVSNSNSMVVGFPNLSELRVWECEKLSHLLPSTTATTLLKLEALDVCGCGEMQRVINVSPNSQEKENCEEARPKLLDHDRIINVLPRLRSLNLDSLQKLECFLFDSGTSAAFLFPSLKDIRVEDCEEMKSFIIIAEPSDHNQSSFFDEKLLLPNLEELTIGDIKSRAIWKNQLPAGSFCELKFLDLCRCNELWNIVPSFMQKRLRNLESLKVGSCSSIKHIYEILDDGSSDNTISSARNTINRHSSPSGGKLRSVKVTNCDRLESVFLASEAGYLVQLQELYVDQCQGIRHIIGVRVDENCARVAPVGSIELPNLSTITLGRLPALSSFCMRGLEVTMPSLMKLVINDDAEMIQQRRPPLPFWLELQGAIPHLQELTVESRNDELVDEILIDCQPQLQLFHRLRVLKVKVGFDVKSAVSASSRLFQMKNLEELELAGASSLEALFDHNAVPAPLRKLKLDSFPELTSIWKEDKFEHYYCSALETIEVSECRKLVNYLVPPTISFQNLTSIVVSKCHGLQALMTASTAKSLPRLKKMAVTQCNALREIVACGDDSDDGGRDEISFFRLEHLELDCLASITHFCSGSRVLKFPSLAQVIFVDCPVMKTFCEGDISTPKLEFVRCSSSEYEKPCRVDNDLNTTVEQIQQRNYNGGGN